MRRFLLLLCLLPSIPAWAGTFNYRPILVGERAVGLGGAYTALSDSGEGGYYNPAGLAFVDQTSLSVAANLYRLTRGSRSKALKFAGDSADLTQDSYNSIPAVASFVKRFTHDAKDAVGLNVVVTEQVDLFGRVDFNVTGGQALLTRSIQDRTLLIGPSYARRVSDRFSLGASVFYSLRQAKSMAFIYQNDATTLGQGFLLETQSAGNLVGKVGLRYSPVENLWLGLTYQPPSIHLHASGSVFTSTIAQDKTTTNVDTTITDNRNLNPNYPIPQTVTLGAAYLKKGNWLVAADLLVHPGDSFAPFRNAAGTEIERETIYNFSVGSEYYVYPNIPLRLGFFSDFSSAPDIRTGVGGQADHVDFLGLAASLSLDTEKTSITLGTTISFGWGEGIDNQMNRIDVEQRNYAVLLGGSYKF
ncbi:MAG: outer membrane protein transport protein [Pseudomonadota bacterium]